MQDSTVHLSAAISTVGLNPSRVLDKTKEFLRLLQMKLPGGSLKKAEAYRHIIAIELACRVQNVPFEKTALLNLAGKPNPNDYKKALCSCKTVLNLTWNSVAVFNVLSVQYGEDVKIDAEKVLEDYRMRQIETVAGKYRAANVDFDSPLYQSAAFFLAAKRKKVKINKVALLQVAEIDSKVFHNVVDKIAKALEEPFVHLSDSSHTSTPHCKTTTKPAATTTVMSMGNDDREGGENNQNYGNVNDNSSSSGSDRMTVTSCRSGTIVKDVISASSKTERGGSSSSTFGCAFHAPEGELVNSSSASSSSSTSVAANTNNTSNNNHKASAVWNRSPASERDAAESAGAEAARQKLEATREEEEPSRKRSDYETWRESILQRKKVKAAATDEF